MSEAAHLDEFSSFMSLYDEDGSGQMLSPHDSYENNDGGVGHLPPMLAQIPSVEPMEPLSMQQFQPRQHQQYGSFSGSLNTTTMQKSARKRSTIDTKPHRGSRSKSRELTHEVSKRKS